MEHITLWDLDGTMALKGERHPFDYTRVDEDTPHTFVIENYIALRQLYRPVHISGREETCRLKTEQWICANGGPVVPELYMRKEGDFRKDSIIKREIYEKFIKPNYHVVMAFDNRNQVVDMWRELSVPVFQVVSREVGNF